MGDVMTIHFLYGRRESLTAKAEAYKKAVRKYLESLGFSQTTDSAVEGTFEDMTFYNPTIEPGRRFLIEAKAEDLSLTNFKLASELVKYFRLWLGRSNGGFKFYFFAQAVKEPERWEALFSEENDAFAIKQWCKWYNSSASKKSKQGLSDHEIKEIGKFFAECKLIVANSQRLETAVCEKEDKATQSISRMSKELLSVVLKRTAPLMKKSNIIMNVLPVELPTKYYVCEANTGNKNEIFEALKDREIPPFVLKSRSCLMYSFIPFDQSNPLTQFAIGQQKAEITRNLQQKNPALCSEIVNVFLRRIVWNRGILRDKDSNISYFPMLEKTKKTRYVKGPNGKQQWVVKRYAYLEDTKYGKKGETNFFFHRGLMLETPTYFGKSYVEISPKKYYTRDGSTPIGGEERKRLDLHFRNPKYDRANTRIRLMRFWRFILFEPQKNKTKPENWLPLFNFGDFVTLKVDWSPNVIERTQTRLWDFGGHDKICE
jgi:hypothetical protein